jgi:ATP-dependent Clp protease ATP-binding subunit ClpC
VRLQAHRTLARPERFMQPTCTQPHGRVQVLQGLVSRYEAHHRVSYTPAAIEAAVTLSERHLPDRRLPDKAIDLLDEAGSRARIGADAARGGHLDIHTHHRQIELRQVVTAKEEAAEEARFEEAALLRERALPL